MAINEATFFYPSDLVNTKTTIPLRVGEERWIYIPRRFTSRYISATIHLPSGDSCMLLLLLLLSLLLLLLWLIFQSSLPAIFPTAELFDTGPSVTTETYVKETEKPKQSKKDRRKERHDNFLKSKSKLSKLQF